MNACYAQAPSVLNLLPRRLLFFVTFLLVLSCASAWADPLLPLVEGNEWRYFAVIDGYGYNLTVTVREEALVLGEMAVLLEFEVRGNRYYEYLSWKNGRLYMHARGLLNNMVAFDPPIIRLDPANPDTDYEGTILQYGNLEGTGTEYVGTHHLVQDGWETRTWNDHNQYLTLSAHEESFQTPDHRWYAEGVGMLWLQCWLTGDAMMELIGSNVTVSVPEMSWGRVKAIYR